MRIDDAAILAGVDIGLIRSLSALQGFRVANPEALREQVQATIRPALEKFSSPKPWGPRGQLIYGELGAMAAAARIRYKEERMKFDVAYDILDPLTRFLNSWLHE